MTRDPLTLPSTASLTQAAGAMRDNNIGAVLVVDGNSQLAGIVTDRDITVRAIADGQDPNKVPLSRIVSKPEHTLSPNDPVDRAVELMGSNYVRRIPVVEGGRAVGIVSLGDLAAVRDPKSVLGQISTAPSTH
ncbi:CBS domain-containing protein [Enhygromyxa salina]|uniref:Hypoxic response protein 1 n=1 Tax=Enhygromyxa salina TaxID=215803 RepID=A0A2S9YLM3_9BACT|nr:CBS domain-containing protein [Enhygromyxa salina]PRQ06011.1 Hypoxic response protein 1 [Enhygromyxa salina]